MFKSILGKGTFGQVFLASLKEYPERLYALKFILPTSAPQRVANEIKCLSLLQGCDKVISLETFVHYDYYILVMPFFEHDKFTEYVTNMTLFEMQDYMKALFMALSSLHELKIIHRDIKPSNCLYNRKQRKFKLIDFGLAQNEDELNSVATHKLYVKNSMVFNKCQHTAAEICNICCHHPTQISPRSGTSGFRPPEVLLKYPNQTTAIDLWSAGVIYLCLLSGKYPFFKASNDLVAMSEIVTLFGSEKCVNAAKSFDKELTCSQVHHSQSLATICERLRSTEFYIPEMNSKYPLNASENTSEIVHSTKTNSSIIDQLTVQNAKPLSEDSQRECYDRDTSNFAPAIAYDLLEKCLDLNPHVRITAHQALQHPFLSS